MSARILSIIVVLFSFVALSLCLSVPSTRAFYSPNPVAQGTSYSTTPSSTATDQHMKAQTLMIDILAAISCQLTGIDPTNMNKSCYTVDVTNGQVHQVEKSAKVGGALGQMAGLIGMTYQIPIHTADYTHYMASHFGLVDHSYAAVSTGTTGGAVILPADNGTGFSNLQPLLGIWIRLRNLTYLIFVVLMVLIGLGIMLRVKIDPKAVMSIQNQIPKIIISILLITFSYAIAGLLIDAMWVTTYLGINILTSEPLCEGGTTITAKATNNLLNTPMSYVFALFDDNNCAQGSWGISKLSVQVGGTIGNMITSVLGSFINGISQAPNCGITNIRECVNQIFFELISDLIGIVAFLIVAIAILVQLFKLWFTLIKSYVYVLMYTALAPLWILLGLLPSASGYGFEQWLRHMVSALAVFPVAAFMFLAAVIVANDPAINTGGPATMFVPPLTGNPAISNNLGMLIALGIILISPEVANMMRNAFKVKQSQYTQAAFAGLGIGAGVAGSIGGGVGAQLFGKNKQGQLGPGSYYALKALGWFSGGGRGGTGGPAKGLGRIRQWNTTRKWRTEQPRYYTDPLTGQEKMVAGTSNTSGDGTNQGTST
jgi:hypothetical protein